jgi:hypothetical protein
MTKPSTDLAKTDIANLMTPAGVLDNSKVLTAYGYQPEEFEFAPDAPSHYYEPETEGDVIFGVVESTFTYENTANGELKSYVLRLTQPAVGVNAETKEREQLEPGDVIGVADRAALKNLEKFVGDEICIINKGKIELKRKPGDKTQKTFWRLVVGRRSNPDSEPGTSKK